MSSVDLYAVSVIIFVIAIAIIFYKDRRNVKRESIVLLRRTKRGRNILIKIGTRFSGLWKVVGVFAVVVCFLASILIFWSLLEFTEKVLMFREDVAGGVAFVIPSVTQDVVSGPGYLAIPFWYWIIAIALLVLVHEGAHGIMAARERVRIKSLGWGLLAVIPLAFVEPDEKQLESKGSWPQLRVFAAGSFANFVLAFVSVVLYANLIAAAFAPTGIIYRASLPGYPAADVNMTGMIVEINGAEVKSLLDMERELSGAGPNQTITVTTVFREEERHYTLSTVAFPEPVFEPDGSTDFIIKLEHVFPGAIDFFEGLPKAYASLWGQDVRENWASITYRIKFWEYVDESYPDLHEKAGTRIAELESRLSSFDRPGFIGIVGVSELADVKPELKAYRGSLEFTEGLLYFLAFINLMVGLVNLLPIGPLDGGRMWLIAFRRLIPNHAKNVMKGLSYFTLFMIVSIFVLQFI